MNQNTNPSEQQMMQFILGKWISKPIYVAAKLGISDMIAKGNRNIEELAEMTTTMADPLYRMMRALAGVGIFTEIESRVFENTPLSECFKKGRLKSAALMFESDWHNNVWDNLLYSIQTGKPSFEKVFDKPTFEWFGKNPKEAEIFNGANSFKAMDSKGKLLIVEEIIPPGNEFSISKLLDLEVLLMGGGCERTEDEFRGLLNRSGFDLTQVIHTSESISIIEGAPEKKYKNHLFDTKPNKKNVLRN
jgi:hypothetical protein